MQEKQSHKCNCRKGCFSSVPLFLAAFLVIPLTLSLFTFNRSSDLPILNTPGQNGSNGSNVPEDELDITGFDDYTYPNHRTNVFRYKDYNLASVMYQNNLKINEITEPDGNQYLEYSCKYGSDYIAYFDSKIDGMTTQDCNGVVISFDIATDCNRLFDRFKFILRDSANNPVTSSVPYNLVPLPDVLNKWQHVALVYDFRENTCDVYIDGERKAYNSAISNYKPSATYTISQLRFEIQYDISENRTYIDNFVMTTYDELNEELITEVETNSGKLLNIPVAYVDGVAHYNYMTLEAALTGDTRKDVVIVAPYQFKSSSIVISCPVRFKNHSPMGFSLSNDLENIGSVDGIIFYDFKKT